MVSIPKQQLARPARSPSITISSQTSAAIVILFRALSCFCITSNICFCSWRIRSSSLTSYSVWVSSLANVSAGLDGVRGRDADCWGMSLHDLLIVWTSFTTARCREASAFTQIQHTAALPKGQPFAPPKSSSANRPTRCRSGRSFRRHSRAGLRRRAGCAICLAVRRRPGARPGRAVDRSRWV